MFSILLPVISLSLPSFFLPSLSLSHTHPSDTLLCSDLTGLNQKPSSASDVIIQVPIVWCFKSPFPRSYSWVCMFSGQPSPSVRYVRPLLQDPYVLKTNSFHCWGTLQICQCSARNLKSRIPLVTLLRLQLAACVQLEGYCFSPGPTFTDPVLKFLGGTSGMTHSCCSSLRSCWLLFRNTEVGTVCFE